MIQLSRRKLIAGLGALIAAPAIVRASSLMPVKAIIPPYDWGIVYEWSAVVDGVRRIVAYGPALNLEAGWDKMMCTVTAGPRSELPTITL